MQLIVIVDMLVVVFMEITKTDFILLRYAFNLYKVGSKKLFNTTEVVRGPITKISQSDCSIQRLPVQARL